MKPSSQMSNAEKAAFKRRPDVQAEYQQFFDYFRILRGEIDSMHNGTASTEDYYCAVRSALGFDHPSMRDPRAPALPLIRPYLLEEINIVCKKPRVMSVNGHLIVPQRIAGLNNSNSNNGYLTNYMSGGRSRRRRRKQRKSRRTRRNNRR